MKTCSKCKKTKQYEDFNRNKQTKDGYRPTCKACRTKQVQTEEKKAYLRQYAKDNRAQMNGYDAKYRVKNGYRVLDTSLMPKDAWQMLLDFYGSKCLKCSRDVELELDHIIPVSLGGDHGLWNAQVLCKSCNSRKQARSTADYRPIEARLVDAL